MCAALCAPCLPLRRRSLHQPMPYFWDRHQRRDPQHARLQISGKVCAPLRYAAIRPERAFGFRIIFAAPLSLRIFLRSGFPALALYATAFTATRGMRRKRGVSPPPGAPNRPIQPLFVEPMAPAVLTGYTFEPWTWPARHTASFGEKLAIFNLSIGTFCDFALIKCRRWLCNCLEHR